MISDESTSAPDPLLDGATSRIDLEEIVRELDLAGEETARWLALFHHSAICKVEPDPSLVVDDAHAETRFGLWYASRRGSSVFDQEAFQSLAVTHQTLFSHAGILARRAWRDARVPLEEYNALLSKVDAFNDQARRLAKAFRAALSDLDPLTGVQTRSTMEKDLRREQHRAFRTGQPCCLALVDVDHFKAVNDTHGHLAGDRVLAAITRMLTDCLRPYDSIYRFGGEEFLLCLPDTGPEKARAVLERVRRSIDGIEIDIGGPETLSVTVSAGVAQLVPRRPVEEITDRADQALYAAKASGRNQVRVWTAEAVRKN